jgi:hypothetical protein
MQSKITDKIMVVEMGVTIKVKVVTFSVHAV